MDSFYRKMYINIFLTLFFLLGFVVFALYSLNKIVEDKNSLVSVHAEELILAQKLHYDISMQFAAMPIYVLSGDEAILKSFENNRKDFTAILTKLLKRPNDSEEKKLLENIFLAEKSMHEYGQKGIAMSRRGVSPVEVNKYFNSTKSAQKDANLPSLLVTLVDTKMREFENAKSEDAILSRKVIFFLGLASLICIVFAGIITSLFIKMTRHKKRTEEKDAFISNARKEIVDTVSHDLKNPLSSIRLGLQYVQRKLSRNRVCDDAEVSKGLTIIFRSVDKMEKLISDLLDHTKLEAGKLVLEPTDCDLAKVTREVIEQLRPIALEKHIQMTATLNDYGKIIKCDQGRVEQVISNIVGNSLKFTPDGGQIDIAMTYKGDDAIVSIHDTGYGMNNEQLEHIFDRYWQAKDTANQGTGLGLAIAKIVVETHHGKIWAESELGKGSTIYFSLPAQAETNKQSYLH